MTPPSSSATTAVSDVMNQGVITCAPSTPLGDVAALMVEHNVHCVIVDGRSRQSGEHQGIVWGVVSDLDVMHAASTRRLDLVAGEAASGLVVTITPEQDIIRAAQLMGEHGCSHLVVLSADGLEPRGVISSLDVARGLASSAPRE